MSNILKEASNLLKEDIDVYKTVLKKSVSSDVNLINTVINYALKRKGKQFRPMLCILSSRLEGEPNESTFLSAATVELLHVATLLHDDVVDEANVRRFWPTVNSIWKNKLSILIGDYMFSKSLNNISNLDSMESIKILAETSNRLSEGEILQIENSINKNMSEETYFKMISDKTASLLMASCQLGYLSNSINNKKINNIKSFGEAIGIAYQLQDDLFDVLGKIDKIGKSSKLDLKKNILTLPYLHMLSKVNNKDKKEIISKLKYYYKREDIKSVKKMIISYNGIEYTKAKIENYIKHAIDELNVFPDSKYKDMLIEIAKYNYYRKS